jgi:hypothetical protein
MTITEKRTLRYDFTAPEIHDLSVQLANETKKVGSLTEEKKSVTSQWTAKINEAKAACNSLSFKVADGYEHRDVECEVMLNVPKNGKKTIIRKDSNKRVGVEDMTTFDWAKINEENNLFNQLEDGEPTEADAQKVEPGENDTRQVDEDDTQQGDGGDLLQALEEDLLTGDNTEGGE